MDIDLVLMTTEIPNKFGFPIVVRFQHQKTRRKKTVARSLPEHWDKDNSMVRNTHPDFDHLYPKLSGYKNAAKRVLDDGITDIDRAVLKVMNNHGSRLTFYDFAQDLMARMKSLSAKYDQEKDYVRRNKVNGNIDVYKLAANQFNKAFPDVAIREIDYRMLRDFRERKLLEGNKNSTVHHYLRTLRAIYNQAVKLQALENKRPFDGVFDGLKTKSYDSKKKYLNRSGLLHLESLVIPQQNYREAVDMWLLQFYFGGVDFIDLYFLKNSRLRPSRVFFERGKSDVPSDLGIHPKARAIIDRYRTEGEYVFPWRKDADGYKTFLRRMQKSLVTVQKSAGIEVNPVGGNLAPKVSRHTFGNLGKVLGVDIDVLRELMGHERDDVDNFYKDRSSEAVRDAALWKIIG